jgi:hypothetical protein
MDDAPTPSAHVVAFPAAAPLRCIAGGAPPPDTPEDARDRAEDQFIAAIYAVMRENAAVDGVILYRDAAGAVGRMPVGNVSAPELLWMMQQQAADLLADGQ